MLEVLARAGCFVVILILGFTLYKILVVTSLVFREW